jgi:hypothetical protein
MNFTQTMAFSLRFMHPQKLYKLTYAIYILTLLTLDLQRKVRPHQKFTTAILKGTVQKF